MNTIVPRDFSPYTHSMDSSARALYTDLLAIHGAQHWWPINHRSTGIPRDSTGAVLSSDHRWEIMVGAVLTQNTSWKNVETALDSLRTTNQLDATAICSAPRDNLADSIRSSGYYNQKARKLQILATAALERGWLDGTPPTRPELMELWGIGPETADCILLYAYGQPVFVIDAYTRRILSRVFPDGLPNGLPGPASDPQTMGYSELQRWFAKELPQDPQLFNEFHAQLVRHGADFCRARPLCAACPLGPQAGGRCTAIHGPQS